MKLTRNGSTLIIVMILLIISLLTTVTAFYLLSGTSKSVHNIKKVDQALLLARSGVEEALVRLKNKECTDNCSLSRNLDSERSYKFSVKKVGKLYEIVSTGKFIDTEKTLVVKVKRKGIDWIPFYLPSGSLELDTPEWKEAAIYKEDLEVNGLTGDDATKELERLGFDVLDEGNKPNFEDIVSFSEIDFDFEPVPSSISITPLEKVVCSGDRNISFDDIYVKFDKSCKLDGKSINQISLVDHPSLKIEIDGNANVGNMLNMNWYKFDSKHNNLLIGLFSTGNVIFSEGIQMKSNGVAPGLAFIVSSGKKITIDSGINVSSGSESDFTIQLMSNEDTDIEGQIQVNSGSYDGNFDMRFYSNKDLNIKGNISFSNFHVNKGINFLAYAKDELKIDGKTNFRSFSANDDISVKFQSDEDLTVKDEVDFEGFHVGGNINLALLSNKDIDIEKGVSFNSLGSEGNISVKFESGEDLTMKDNVNFHDFHALGGDINLDLFSKKSINIEKNISFGSLGAEKSISVNLKSKEDLDAEEASLDFKSFSVRGSLDVNVISGKNLKLGNISLSKFSGLGEASINLEAKEDIVLEKPVSIMGMGLEKSTSLSLISGKSIKADDNDLFSMLEGHFQSNLNLFALAKEAIIASNIEKISNAGFSSNINTLIWGDENISGNIRLASFNLQGNLNYSLITSNSINSKLSCNLNPFDLFIDVPCPDFINKFSGLSKSELEEICNTATGKVKEIACNIINAMSSENDSGGLEIISAMEK